MPEKRWTPGRIWEGETAVVIGSGPSLTKQDREHTKGRARVIALNREWRWTPWADILYVCDGKYFFLQDADGHDALTHFNGHVVTQDYRAVAERPRLKWVEVSGREGLSTTPGFVRSGRTSAHQAINLACQLGVVRVLLLGIDLKFAPDGRQHHYPEPKMGLKSEALEIMARYFPSLVEPLNEFGVEVVNCSPSSALDLFPKARIQEVLA